VTTTTLTGQDEQRRQGLRRMRTIALGLLVFAAVVFLATLHRGGAWGYVNATAEAAMIGALADWFAVTALFRHPLGIPVPHTAIIPSRKDELGRSLQEFVTTHFLTEPVARERVAAADVSRRLGGWLEREPNATRVLDEAARLSRRGLESVREEDVRDFVDSTLLPRLVDEPMSPLAGHLLGSVVKDGAHHGLVDLVTVEAHAWLLANEATVAKVVGARAPWWSPAWLDERIVDRVQVEVRGWVADVRDRPGHPARRAVDALLAQLAEDLQHDPPTMARAEALKERVLAHPEVGSTVVAVWDALRSAVVSALGTPDGPLMSRAREALAELSRRLQHDTDFRDMVDGYAGDAAGYVARSYGPELASVISQTVTRWDGRETAERIELHVGRDLQFIRINGTVVGGLVGLLIHAVSRLL